MSDSDDDLSTSIDDVGRPTMPDWAEAARTVTGAVGEAVPQAREAMQQADGVVRGLQRAADVAQQAMAAGEALLDLLEDNRAVAWELETLAYPEVSWAVMAAHVREALHEPYLARVTVRTEQTDVDPAEILGAGCTLRWRRGGHVQQLRGLALKVIEGALDPRAATLTLEIGPAFALLAHRRDSRVFQAQTVPEILESVIGEALRPYERSVQLELDETYPKREYCLQFDETDLAFVQRLIEEEGLGYRFEHEGENEELFLFDRNAKCPAVSTLDGADVPHEPRSHEVTTREPVARFDPTSLLGSTSLALRDFDWTRQGEMRVGTADSGADARGRDREVYEHVPRVLCIGDYDAGVLKYGANDAARQAQIRAELLRLPQRTARGLSRVTGFRAGTRFTLTGHPNVGADQEYLLTQVEHFNEAPPAADESQPSSDLYHNAFEVIPADVPWRPARTTRKPRIHSIQTAVVVGPGGEEIHTDEHGRIKIELHWDRLGKADEHSSCWVRVQQPWAGSGWGFLFTPRVGMEVLVSFLDGDPDRPLVIGSVYNGTNRPPYALPDEKTKSTIKTSSTPGGNGFNELRFEDKAGSEEIYVHAQKDYNEVIEHDHTTHVRNDQTNTVDGNQVETIGKNRTVHIKGSQSVTIDGERGNCGHSGSKLAITGNYTVDASDKIEMQAPTHFKITCGGSSILVEPSKITLTAGGGATIVLDANALIKSAAGSEVFLDANALTQSSGGSHTLHDANAFMKASGGASLLLDGNANLKSSGGSQVLLDGSATMTGVAVAEINGPTSKVLGGNLVEIKGALVKINC